MILSCYIVVQMMLLTDLRWRSYCRPQSLILGWFQRPHIQVIKRLTTASGRLRLRRKGGCNREKCFDVVFEITYAGKEP